jgi:alkanesulfonate monooxygenase SsuD/methylene tetrahydromethanopterin reductase-like flavin-dependent oxidoreductase (luciferase family)
VTDSPIIRSNCWAVLALAAQATRSMRIGTGVNVPALRLAPAAANGIATINRLAPGRCFIGFGTGHTGCACSAPARCGWRRSASTSRSCGRMLRGEEVAYTLEGETHPIRFQMREHRFIDLDHPIPVYVAGFGPKAPGLAGEIGDGLVSGLPRGGTLPAMLAERAARRRAGGAGAAADFYTSAMVTLVMREPGEALDSPRIVS